MLAYSGDAQWASRQPIWRFVFSTIALVATLVVASAAADANQGVLAAAATPTPTPTPSWVYGAAEYASFTLPAGVFQVRFGSGVTYVQVALSGTVLCTTSTFGSDPTPNVVKHCDYLAAAGGAAATPAPTPTPTPTPVSSGIPVPSSIDATGVSDASAGLTSFLATVPNGSTISFKAGGVYRMDHGLEVSAAHQNLIFEGNGATLKSNGDWQEPSSLFIVEGSNILIRDFTLLGNDPTPGVQQIGEEYEYGVQAYGASRVEVTNVTIADVWGDCLMVGNWADTIYFHDSTCQSAGRQGVSILAGSNVTVERVNFGTVGGSDLDIEPYQASGGANHVIFRNNTCGTHGVGLPSGRAGYFFAADGTIGSTINDVTITGNTVTGGSPDNASGGSIDANVTLTTRRTNIVFTNNTSLVASSPPYNGEAILMFAHIDGLTVTGNTQPLLPGAVFASITDSTGVTYP